MSRFRHFHQLNVMNCVASCLQMVSYPFMQTKSLRENIAHIAPCFLPSTSSGQVDRLRTSRQAQNESSVISSSMPIGL